jgi:hypothetical protein
MTIDTRTEAERRYDSLRDGSAWEKVIPILVDPDNDGAEPAATCTACGCELAPRANYCDSCGQPATLLLAVADYIDEQLGSDEARAIDILLVREANQALADSLTMHYDDGWHEFTTDLINLAIDDVPRGKTAGRTLWICGFPIEDQPATYDLLAELARDLGHLLADPRVVAALTEAKQ